MFVSSESCDDSLPVPSARDELRGIENECKGTPYSRQINVELLTITISTHDVGLEFLAVDDGNNATTTRQLTTVISAGRARLDILLDMGRPEKVSGDVLYILGS